MKIGITGSKGFIGQNLLKYLHNNHIDCVELDSALLDSFSKQEISHIVHLAAKTSVQDSFDNIPLFLESNVTLTAKVLDFAVKIGASVTLFSTYGYYPSNNIASPYHLTKEFSEQLAFFYYQKFGLPINILRLASVYGAGQKKGHLIPTILEQVLNPEIKEIVVKSLSSKRVYTDVRDVVRFILTSCQHREGFHINYAGNSEFHSVEELIQKSLLISGSSKPYKEMFSDEQDLILSTLEKNATIKNSFPWTPLYSLDEGLNHLIGCMQQS